MKNELTQDERKYLQERGFQILNGPADESTKFPYVTLREPQEHMENSEITYHHTRSSPTATMNICHPSRVNKDVLVGIIEKMVGSGMTLEGGIFTTTPGKPIKVYVIDKSWNEVSEELESKYQ